MAHRNACGSSCEEALHVKRTISVISHRDTSSQADVPVVVAFKGDREARAVPKQSGVRVGAPTLVERRANYRKTI